MRFARFRGFFAEEVEVKRGHRPRQHAGVNGVGPHTRPHLKLLTRHAVEFSPVSQPSALVVLAEDRRRLAVQRQRRVATTREAQPQFRDVGLSIFHHYTSILEIARQMASIVSGEASRSPQPVSSQ
jgi:hypothetical protein